ncbi:MAG: hypothetical protein R3B54_13060 [Bdellovibrionota bacterium]
MEKPVVDAIVQIRPERVEKFAMTMKAPGNDLRVQGSVHSFTAPKVKIDVASKGMDLDRLLNENPRTVKGQKSVQESAAVGGRGF